VLLRAAAPSEDSATLDGHLLGAQVLMLLLLLLARRRVPSPAGSEWPAAGVWGLPVGALLGADPVLQQLPARGCF
jgi:hypothetical protein